MSLSFLSLFEAAALIGEAQLLETRLFEVLGHSSTLAVDPEKVLLLSVVSRRHVNLAESFGNRLPVSASIPTQPFRAVVTPEGRAILASLDDEHLKDLDDNGVLFYLSGEVLPLLVRFYEDFFASTSPTSDGPVRVVLDEALAVLEDELDLFGTLQSMG